jgi:phosphoserine phosphatase
MRLALFDLDHTLLTGDSDYEWGQFMCDRGVVDRAAYEAQNRISASPCARSLRTRRRTWRAGTPSSWRAASGQ